MRLEPVIFPGKTAVLRLFGDTPEETVALAAIQVLINENTDTLSLPIAVGGQKGISIILKPKKKLP